jgi:hypothetical protein
VLDALNNGWENLIKGLPELGLEQIENAKIALNNGMLPNDVIQETLDSPLILSPSGK